MKFIYDFILTATGVALFSYIDNARWSVTTASVICGVATFTLSEQLTQSLGGGFIMYFLSATLTCFLSEIGARLLCVPATVILLPAIIPLVPGSLLYSAMKGLIIGDALWYSNYGKEALNATAGIGVAIVSVSAGVRLVYEIKTRLLLNRKVKK